MSNTISSKREDSDSISSNSLSPKKPIKHKKHHGKSSSSKYKGVVPQQNGNWGAQIYANHQRIWLGTFKTEAEAAAAYDSAAVKLRRPGGTSTEPHRNFPWDPLSLAYEPKFQAQYTIEQVLNMIKDGSYQTKFLDYVSSFSQDSSGCQTYPNQSYKGGGKDGYFCQELFRKELTPSDVGKLNRLVIPKRYAIKYFPSTTSLSLKGKQDLDFDLNSDLWQQEEQCGEVMELILYDRAMRSWKFRYCYWKSSESFVFTRGWNKFVKDKDLKASDIVAFYLCELRDNTAKDGAGKFIMIDIVPGCNDQVCESTENRSKPSKDNDCISEGRNVACGNLLRIVRKENECFQGGEEVTSSNEKLNKTIRLFGVDICLYD